MYAPAIGNAAKWGNWGNCWMKCQGFKYLEIIVINNGRSVAMKATQRNKTDKVDKFGPMWRLLSQFSPIWTMQCMISSCFMVAPPIRILLESYIRKKTPRLIVKLLGAINKMKEHPRINHRKLFLSPAIKNRKRMISTQNWKKF